MLKKYKHLRSKRVMIFDDAFMETIVFVPLHSPLGSLVFSSQEVFHWHTYIVEGHQGRGAHPPALVVIISPRFGVKIPKIFELPPPSINMYKLKSFLPFGSKIQQNLEASKLAPIGRCKLALRIWEDGCFPNFVYKLDQGSRLKKSQAHK